MSGSLHGGQQPVAGSTVKVYAAGTTGYGSAATLLGTTLSDSHGNFQFASGAVTCPQSNTPVYIVATGGDTGSGNNASLSEAAGLGACSNAVNATVQITEVTTVATAFALAQFFTPTLGASSSDSFGAPSTASGSTTVYSKGLSMANAVTIPTLVSLPGGIPQASTTSTTVDDLKMRTIANILASCVNSKGAGTGANGNTTPCDILFQATRYDNSKPTPTDTLQAAVNIARYPFSNVQTLLNLAAGAGPFGPGVSTANDFTVAVQYTTPSLGLTLAANSTTNLDIDASGNVWLPSTAPAGVAMFSPSSGTFSFATQGGMVAPQNVAISNAGNIFVADQGSPYLSAFSATGGSGGQFNSGGTSQPSVAIGPKDQIWVASTGNAGSKNFLTELSGGLLSAVQTNLLTGVTTYPVTSMTVAPNNDVYSGTFSNNSEYLESYNASIYVAAVGIGVPVLPVDSVNASYGALGAGSISRNGGNFLITTPGNNTFCANGGTCAAKASAGMSAPASIATDGDNKVWTANSNTASVSVSQGSAGSYAAFSPIAYIHSGSTGPLLPAPAGIALDASGNVWVSNTNARGGSYVLTELVGAAAPTITPLAAQIVNGINNVGTRPTN